MKILVVDDDKIGRNSIVNFLGNYLNHQVEGCSTITEAWDKIRQDAFLMVIIHIRMSNKSGFELLERVKASHKHKSIDVVVITGQNELETGVQALRSGAYDYLQKPVIVEELASIVDKVAEHQDLLKENQELKKNMREKLEETTKDIQKKYNDLKNAFSEIVGVGQIGIFSDKMKDIYSLSLRLHQNREIPVLIQGETGTGKEVVAKLIHYGEANSTAPFITLNCSAISPSLFESELFGYEPGAFTGADRKGKPGKLEMAQGGTLFLDEIGDMPIEQQPKLLRVLQEKEMYRLGGTKKIQLNVRIISATNLDLDKALSEKKFRKDLFFRMSTGNVSLPPLRERREEILPLAHIFMTKYSELKKKKFKLISKKAQESLYNYDWPGNVRELQNTIERVVLLYNNLEIKNDYLDFSDDNYLKGQSNLSLIKDYTLKIDLNEYKMPLEKIERQAIKKALELFEGNRSKTADYLNISRNTLRRKMRWV